MICNSSLALKRRRLTNIAAMDGETAKAMLSAAREKYGREIRVFETFRTSESSDGTPDAEESDGFYEFTPEDYHRILATKKEDKHLKTRKMREAEQAARRARMTKSVIRVRFPDNHTLEARFHSAETMQALVDFLKGVIARPELPYYLYTTPPRKQIKDMSQDLYSAGFVPGAIVHFSYDLPKEDEAHLGPFLVEELISLKGLELVQDKPDAVSPSIETKSTNEPPPPTAPPERKPTEKKAIKPKWLKM